LLLAFLGCFAPPPSPLPPSLFFACKVYFRYLLLNGRKHYSNIFTSQQTWLLFSIQLLFITVQGVGLFCLGTDVNFNQAMFMAVNTRHAGFTAVNLNDQNSGILVLFLAMMFLAPTPFVVVLRSSDKETAKTRDRSGSVLIASDLATLAAGSEGSGEGAAGALRPVLEGRLEDDNGDDDDGADDGDDNGDNDDDGDSGDGGCGSPRGGGAGGSGIG
jgi:hypothetical protein